MAMHRWVEETDSKRTIYLQKCRSKKKHPKKRKRQPTQHRPGEQKIRPMIPKGSLLLKKRKMIMPGKGPRENETREAGRASGTFFSPCGPPRQRSSYEKKRTKLFDKNAGKRKKVGRGREGLEVWATGNGLPRLSCTSVRVRPEGDEDPCFKSKEKFEKLKRNQRRDSPLATS